MTTVAVIGAGDLGGAVAHALAMRDAAARILLVDDAEQAAAGKALDIQQSGAVAGFHTRLAGTADLTRVSGCSACVIADRAGRPPVEWQGDEGLARLTAVARFAGTVPIVCAGTAQAELIVRATRELKLAPGRMLGSAPEALSSAMRAIVAVEARCAPSEVMLAVVGAPPDGFVVPWSDASIGGYALASVLSVVQLARIEARVARLWPPQPYALGLAAAVVVEGLLASARRSFSVLTLLEGEFGVRGRVGALPVLLSAGGIVMRRSPALSTRERVQLETALGA